MTLTVPATSSVIGTLVVVLLTTSTAFHARSWPLQLRRRFEVGLAWAIVALLVASKAIEAGHGIERLAWLPLHVCDVSSIACAVALLRGGSLPRAIMLYFGVGLSSFALLFPDLDAGPSTIAFWVFWMRHTAILAAGLYDVIARGFRPSWRDYGRWCAFGTAYVAIVSLVNVLAHTNFAFIADQTLPSTPILQSFGEWPVRSAVMLGLAVVHAAVITLVMQALPVRGPIDPAAATPR